MVSTPELFVLHPTPMQVRLRHETPWRELEVAAEGFGVPWIDQAVPFHASAKVLFDSPLRTEKPTVPQDVSVAQETSCKTLAMLPAGLGVLCSVQVETPLKR